MHERTLLHDDLLHAAARCPDKLGVVCGDRQHSYAQLLSAARAVASALTAKGVRRGDRVALFMDNGFEFIAGVYGALLAGAVFMPVNPQTKTDKLAYMLGDARPAALLTQATLAGTWLPAVALAGTKTVFALPAPNGSHEPAAGALPWPCDDDTSLPLPGTIDADLAAIIYTSGSTGFPKGVMLSHLNMVTAARSISSYLGLRADDRIFCALPLAFDYGLYQVLMTVRVGATVIVERGFVFPVKALELMVRERATVFPGVPTMFSMLMALKSLSEHDLSALRLITNTAAALPEVHIHRLRALFPKVTLFSMYGLTECKRVTFLPPDQLDVRPGSVGRGMPNQEVWLVDEDGARLPNGSTGELVIRGNNVMLGYWEKPEETAKRLKPGPLPGERLLYSGDLFRTDAEGWLYFVARRDDIIKTRGAKVSPKEVENAIHSLDGVHEVAVIGVPDAVLGQAVKARITLLPGAAVTERMVMQHCQQRLESFMVPKFVEFLDELPKSDNGKIRKTEPAQAPA